MFIRLTFIADDEVDLFLIHPKVHHRHFHLVRLRDVDAAFSGSTPTDGGWRREGRLLEPRIHVAHDPSVRQSVDDAEVDEDQLDPLTSGHRYQPGAARRPEFVLAGHYTGQSARLTADRYVSQVLAGAGRGSVLN